MLLLGLELGQSNRGYVMDHLGTVEDTAFVPLLGRIYCSRHYGEVLFDPKALELESKIPSDIKDNDKQKQYTLMASASRSANMDRYISSFLKRETNGVIVELGIGLETTYYRHNKKGSGWYGVDLDNVIAYRKSLLGEEEIELIYSDAFKGEWIDKVQSQHPTSKVLVVCSGLFYYFGLAEVLGLLKKLKDVGNFEIVFDAVNKSGMKMMQRSYMKQVGHSGAKVYFYVDNALDLVRELGNGSILLAEEPFYKYIDKSGLKIGTKFNMGASDLLRMVKMVHISL